MKLDRFKTHDIEIVIDKLVIKQENKKRLKQSIETAMKFGNGLLITVDINTEKERFLVDNSCVQKQVFTLKPNQIVFLLIPQKVLVSLVMDLELFLIST